MPRALRGLDELALETAFIGVSAIVFIVVANYALNSPAGAALSEVPILGTIVSGARTLVGHVAN